MKTDSVLLSNPKKPIVVDKKLAAKIGLNKAIVLSHLYTMLKNNHGNAEDNFRDGRYWVCKSVKEWQEIFPFWSFSTVKRTLASLKEQGMIITANYNKAEFDNTNWYTINFDKFPDGVLDNKF